MGRYILRYGPSSAAPTEHLQDIRQSPGIKVIDETPKMLLVDAEESALREKVKGMPGWSLHSEHGYEIPDTRKTIR